MTNYYKVHLKIRELNGKMFVLCGRDAGTLAHIVDDPMAVTCDSCISRINIRLGQNVLKFKGPITKKANKP